MYVRTKDGVYEVKVNKYHELVYCKDNQIVLSCNIIKQSETIEELCDELFVYVRKQNEDYEKIEMPIIDITRNLTSLIKIANFTNSVVLGAIWTSKGLIYVAKMNENGELELI